MAVPICNSLTFIFTAIAAKLLGKQTSPFAIHVIRVACKSAHKPHSNCTAAGEEQRITPKVLIGTALIAAGVGVCVFEKM